VYRARPVPTLPAMGAGVRQTSGRLGHKQATPLRSTNISGSLA